MSTSSARFRTTTRRRSSQSFVPDRYVPRVGYACSTMPFIRGSLFLCCLDCGGRRHVQAPSVPAHRHDREYLCVSAFDAGSDLSSVADTLYSYCPGGPDSDFDYSTQSYTGYEPTSMRAIRARYDPYEQTRGRVEQLKALGHSVDKVRIVVPFGRRCSFEPRYLGRIYHHGWHVHEHARGLPHKVYRSATQCPLRIYWSGCRRSSSLLGTEQVKSHWYHH